VSEPAPHLRFDEWTDTWVAMAPGRRGIGAMRPGGMPEPSVRCPFCPGHEADAEVASLSIGEPWRVRAVANRFPLTRPGAVDPGLAGAVAAGGAHEVIVESREHDRDLSVMSPAEASDVLLAWRDRSRALGRLTGTRAVILFRNKGRRAGSSQPHPHSQIVALPFVPPLVARRAELGRRFLDAHGRSLVTHTLDHEREARVRIVRDADGVLTYCPFASTRAWATRVLLDRSPVRFAELEDARLGTLASHLVEACRRALHASGATDYNVLVVDPPLDETGGGFSIEIVPRTGGDAGFELATGTSVCVVLPEDAAAAMREASVGRADAGGKLGP